MPRSSATRPCTSRSATGVVTWPVIGAWAGGVSGPEAGRRQARRNGRLRHTIEDSFTSYEGRRCVLPCEVEDETVDGFWRAVSPRMTRNGRTRMLCLQWYERPSVARQCYAVWSALSAACHHHHTYELPPTPPKYGPGTRT